MTQNFISKVSIQFEYFDIQLNHPDWKGKKVLDFGGNIGNILLNPNCKIEEENYCCLDVSESVIEEGQKRYPLANFVFYNSYNLSFNPSGILDLPIPDLGDRFDYVLAYSIFSHMEENEMMKKIEQLLSYLNIGGVLVFTFLVPDFNGSDHFQDFQNISNFEKRLMRLNDGKLDGSLVEKSKNAQSLVLVNEKNLYLNGEQYSHIARDEGDTLFTYFSPEYLKSILDCEIKSPPSSPYYPMYPAELQHACIIKKS